MRARMASRLCGSFTLIEEFDAIETLLLDQFDFDSKANCRFYEVDAQALIWSQNSPIDILRRRTSGLPAFDDVASVVNLPLAGFGVGDAYQWSGARPAGAPDTE